MSVRLVHPWLLLALVPLALIAIAVHVRVAPPVTPRRRLWAALHWTAIGLLVVGLAQPEIRSGKRPPTVLVLDRSATIDPTMDSTERSWVQAVAGSGCVKPCRVVQFAAGAQPLPASQAALAAHQPSGTQDASTNIEAGVDTALGLVPRGGRIVVLSNGWQTTGNAAGAAARARADGVQVDNVQLTDPAFRYAAVTSVSAPPVVHAGDPVPLQVTIRSSVVEPVTLYIIRDGAAVGQQIIDVHRGDNPLLLTYTAPSPGWHSFGARVTLFSNDLTGDSTLSTTVDVVGPPRVLVAAGGSDGQLTSMLKHLGFAVGSTSPSGLPTSAAALRGDDAVVLDDVPETAVDGAQVAALSSAVRNGGLGLLVLGGPHSYSLGRYSGTQLEQLLPVTSLVPGNLQRHNVAIQLVLDHSGSMIDLAGGVPKIQMVHVAGTEVTKFIAAHKDDLGVIDFDIAPHTLVPMEQVSSTAVEQSILSKVNRLQANGGTNIYAALVAGLHSIEKSSAPEKHIILMTDGISQPENYTPVLDQLRRAHIEVATIALGVDADKSLLQSIAKATGGNYYYTNDAHQLPRIFTKETRFDVKPVKLSGKVKVIPGTDSPVVSSLSGKALPPLSGNVVTNLKNGAQADLLAAGMGAADDPALAQWQDGAGRVVSFTPGYGAPWASAWTRQSSLWNEALRWVQRGVTASPLTPTSIPGAPPSLQIDLATAGAQAFGVSTITGNLTASGVGGIYPITFNRVDPSLYEASLAGVPQGVYNYSLTATGDTGLTTSGLVAVPYSLEYEPQLPSSSPVRTLAALTGGHELAAGDPGALTGGGWRASWWVLALIALALFLVGAVGRMLERFARDEPPDDYSATRPAVRAEPASRSTAETSVGARM